MESYLRTWKKCNNACDNQNTTHSLFVPIASQYTNHNNNHCTWLSNRGSKIINRNRVRNNGDINSHHERMQTTFVAYAVVLNINLRWIFENNWHVYLSWVSKISYSRYFIIFFQMMQSFDKELVEHLFSINCLYFVQASIYCLIMLASCC